MATDRPICAATLPRFPALAVLFLSMLSRGLAANLWFPEVGAEAIHQRSLDVKAPAVVMVVALQPGYEDLPLLAYLRFHAGATTATVFLTNGEGTPGDTLARYPLWVTGERKVEADRVASRLGGTAWFLNMPDISAPRSAAQLETAWETAGAEGALARAIRSFKPDVVVLCPDRRSGGNPTHRDSAAFRIVQRAIAFAPSPTDTAIAQGITPWKVARWYVQRDRPSMPAGFRAVHPFFHLSSLSMADVAARSYRTLRLQITPWLDAGRAYYRVTGARTAARATRPADLAAGLPAIPRLYQRITTAIAGALKRSPNGVFSASLIPVADAIVETERVLIAEHRTLTPEEQRVLVTWKNGLEALRCAILNVSVKASPSDSLLTASQVWTLSLSSPQPFPKQGTTEIVFPLAMNGDWNINQTLTYHFPLALPASFTILTPPELPFAVPADFYGLRQPSMKTMFPYIIAHKDPQRERSFMIRGEVGLDVGPIRSFVLRTPLIYDSPSSPVIFALQNFSRDPFEGVVTLSDSAGLMSRSPVALQRKDQILLDTLYLSGGTPPGVGNRLLTLALSGRGGERSITARRFHVAIDSSVDAGLVSTLDSSPLADALRVLGQPGKTVEVDGGAGIPGGMRILILDRDVASDPRVGKNSLAKVEAWIRNGGRALIFPQHGTGARWVASLMGYTFAPCEPVPPDAEISLEVPRLASFPNPIDEKGWEGWVESRAFDKIVKTGAGREATVVLRSGKEPLILTAPVGKGSITLVAADLVSQLINYHPGAFRLFSNLIAAEGGR